MTAWSDSAIVTASNPYASRCLRKDGRRVRHGTSTVKRIWQWALARGGTALTGFSGLPVEKAKTSNVFQANTFSGTLRPGSPHQESIAGPSAPPSTMHSASAARTDRKSTRLNYSHLVISY